MIDNAMQEGLYCSDDQFDQQDNLDGLPVGMFLGYCADSLKEKQDICQDLVVGVACFRITEDTVNIIFIIPRYDGDDGNDAVAGWTVFAEFARKNYESYSQGRDMATAVYRNCTRLIRSHNIAVRALINDFYPKFVAKDGDMDTIRNHMVIIWRLITGFRPVSSNRDDRYSFCDTVEDACRILNVSDYLVKAYDYLFRDNSDKDIVEVRKLFKDNLFRFIVYVHDKKSKNGTIMFRISCEYYPVAVFRIIDGEVSACMIMRYDNVDDFRGIFWWITTADEEYDLLESALNREFHSFDD